MEKQSEHIDELIGKVLSAEANADEIAFVNSWIAKAESNRRYYEQFRLIFNSTGELASNVHFDTDAAWNNLREKLKEKEAKVVPLTAPSKLTLYLRIAASVIFVFALGYLVFKPNTSVTSVQLTAGSTTNADTLPDGTNVFMNKTTQLAYEFDKKENQHKVKLKGEAYFNIKHEEKKDFIIEVDDVFVKDIGTSFNVKAYPESKKVEVVVEDGEVIFYSTNDSVFLIAGEKGVYDRVLKQFSVVRPEPNATAYKTRTFIFNNADLTEIAKALNAVYDEKIIIDEQLQKCRLTVTFTNEEMSDVSEVIAETLGLGLRKENNRFILEGESCVTE